MMEATNDNLTQIGYVSDPGINSSNHVRHLRKWIDNTARPTREGPRSELPPTARPTLRMALAGAYSRDAAPAASGGR
jgi:hypothetical protein